MITAPKDPQYPSDKDYPLFDVCNRNHPRPPSGVTMLILNEGGVVIKGKWDKSVRYWRRLPDVPQDPSPEDFIPMPV